ncbi:MULTISPECIES: TetR/AcrR family transcriptional regulator [unclassified Streptomyces]|uniref:TetR/AcrR family transcriptional regulator n=1 Tax=unclassified Streptomyces TaxID=2593676 RepID=UPI002E16FD56|nr:MULTISPECIES: TetR/AcrR family transcriptional regulator [unclassified Streptomyces]
MTQESGRIPRKGTVEKRQALMRGARTVFGREGYARAGIDEIAAEAGVSTRTLYNHFGGKENLFREVLIDSAKNVTSAHVALIERHLAKVTDVEKDLLALAREWMGRRGDHEPHMLLVRHIISEGAHLPADVIEEWQRIGPRGTAEAVRAALLRLGEQGYLAVDEANSAEAGRHFLLLIPGSVTVDTFFGVVPMSDAEVDARVSSGLGVFLKLYGR